MGQTNPCRPCQPCNKPAQKSQLHQSSIIEVYSNKFFVKGKLNFNKQSTFKKLQIAANELCMSSGVGIQYAPIIMRLLAFQHNNVFQAFSTLNVHSRIEFMDKMSEIYLDLMDSLYEFLILNEDRKRIIKELKLTPLKPFQPLSVTNIKLQDKLDLINQGVGLLNASKVAIVFMCSGASSRFFFQDKFLHPLEIHDRETTLLKVLFQKLKENYKPKFIQQTIDIPIVLIGNQTNTESIEFYLKEHDFFNFDKNNIFFSTVPSLPILDENGKICLNFEYNYLRRPKGSACCLEEILHPDAMKILKEKQIEYVHLVGTQNLAESPGDPLFIGLTHMLKRKVSIKCTSIVQPFEPFDRLIDHSSGKVRVIDHESLQQLDQPQLFESDIAMNSMVFALDGLSELVEKFNNDLHLAGLYRGFKINENFYDFKLKKPLINQPCWTFEKDIKDTIACADKPLVLKVDRKEFIPIITSKKEYSIQEAVQTYVKEHPRKRPGESKVFFPYHSSASSTTSEQDLRKSDRISLEQSIAKSRFNL